MADSKISDLEKKKQELEEELVKIQNGLDRSIDEVREGVSHSMAPKNIIKKYPLPALGASLLIGFLAGREGKRSGSGRSARNRSNDDTASALSSELKKILAKKGLNLLLNYLDDKIAELKHRDTSSGD